MKSKLPQGYGGGAQNMQGMIKQAQKMQEDMEVLQAQLDTKEYTINAGGGVVTVVITGKKEFKTIDIKPEVVDPDDIETLTDILVAACNEAVKKVEEINQKEMEKVTGGLNVPGMF